VIGHARPFDRDKLVNDRVSDVKSVDFKELRMDHSDQLLTKDSSYSR
jgi:hypothetical protein